jgi:hypothetical protein
MVDIVTEKRGELRLEIGENRRTAHPWDYSIPSPAGKG